MRLGGMHTNMAFLASIGKLYGDGGLSSLWVDSDVYASATAKLMMQGKHYSRGIRALQLASEALFRLFHESSMLWVQKQSTLKIDEAIITTHVQDVEHAFELNDRTSSRELTESLEASYLAELQKVYDEFVAAGRAQSATFAYWHTFMEGVDVLLRLLRAERDGMFELHLDAIREALPWFTAADRSNYSKYLPSYINDMQALQVTHPESYKYLLDGGFSVRRSSHQFNAVASDQALEQTINREGKSQGGVIGFTLSKGALTRWLTTRHITAAFSEAVNSLCDTKHKGTKGHAQQGKARMARDERDVLLLKHYISNNQNPFDLDTVPDELVNIATGKVAPTEVSKGLGQFLQKANQKNTDFVQTRLDENRTASFCDTVSRIKTPTFANMFKQIKLPHADKLMVDSEVLFRRLLGVSKQRDICLEQVLKHELAAVPPSLFNNDGTMRKTTKSELAKKLEGLTDDVQMLPDPDQHVTAYIIDGMALLHATDEKTFDTFNDFGRVIMQRILSLMSAPHAVKSVTLVFDRYTTQSIKQLERERRCAEISPNYVIVGSHKVPNYRKFLTNPNNKAALAKFISHYLLERAQPFLGNDQAIILAGGFEDGKQVRSVTHTAVTDEEYWYSSHEEADTRMILHAVHLAETHSRIVIRCDDTDVLVLLIYYCSKRMLGSSVFMHAGHSGKLINRQRYIPVTNIVEKIGSNIAFCLPAAHAITGCDSTSSFFKVGKRTAYTKLAQNTEELQQLSELGLSEEVQIIPTCTKYVLLLYACKSSHASPLTSYATTWHARVTS